jgi:hypothetical protein
VALPKFEDFKAPWELDKDGKPIPVEDQKPDPEQLKKHLYNVLGDKEKAQASRDEATGKVTELQGQLKVKSEEGLSELEKLQASVNDLTKQATDANLKAGKLELIQEFGLEKDDLAFLTGADAEANKAIAERLKARVGETKTTEGDQGGGNPLETTPKERHNPGDRNDNTPKLPTSTEFRDLYRSRNQNPFG